MQLHASERRAEKAELENESSDQRMKAMRLELLESKGEINDLVCKLDMVEQALECVSACAHQAMTPRTRSVDAAVLAEVCAACVSE